MTTVQLNETAVLLDGLYTSYQSIFKQATEQLESVNLTNEHVSRIAEKLMTSTDHRSRLIQDIHSYVIRELEEPGNTLIERIAVIAADKVWSQIGSDIQNAVNSAWVTYLDSDECKEQLDKQIALTEPIKQALSTELLVKALLRTASE